MENKPVDKAVPQTEPCLDTREQVSRWISIHRSRFHECSIQLNVTSVSVSPRDRLEQRANNNFSKLYNIIEWESMFFLELLEFLHLDFFKKQIMITILIGSLYIRENKLNRIFEGKA